MRQVYVLVVILVTGCASEGFMGDTPTISPQRPTGDVKVEMQNDNMICVTENNDSRNRSCVPVVHDREDSNE